MSQSPEEILTNAWSRVSGAQALGEEWHFALGALWALGTAGLLDDAGIRRWEAVAQAEARRLRGPQDSGA